MLNQTLALEALSFSLGGSYSGTLVRNILTIVKGITGSGSFPVMKDWKGTLALSYSDRNDGGYKLGFSIRTNIKLWKTNDLELRAEKNTYSPGVTVENGYDQLRFRLTISNKW